MINARVTPALPRDGLHIGGRFCFGRNKVNDGDDIEPALNSSSGYGLFRADKLLLYKGAHGRRNL